MDHEEDPSKGDFFSIENILKEQISQNEIRPDKKLKKKFKEMRQLIPEINESGGEWLQCNKLTKYLINQEMRAFENHPLSNFKQKWFINKNLNEKDVSEYEEDNDIDEEKDILLRDRNDTEEDNDIIVRDKDDIDEEKRKKILYDWLNDESELSKQINIYKIYIKYDKDDNENNDDEDIDSDIEILNNDDYINDKNENNEINDQMDIDFVNKKNDNNDNLDEDLKEIEIDTENDDEIKILIKILYKKLNSKETLPLINEIDNIFKKIFNFKIIKLPTNKSTFSLENINYIFKKKIFKLMFSNKKIINTIEQILNIKILINNDDIMKIEQIMIEYFNDKIDDHKKLLNIIYIFLNSNFCSKCGDKKYKKITWWNIKQKSNHKC